MKNKTIFTFNMHVLNNSTLTPHTGKFQGELLTLVEAFSFPLQILNYNLQRIQWNALCTEFVTMFLDKRLQS